MYGGLKDGQVKADNGSYPFGDDQCSAKKSSTLSSIAVEYIQHSQLLGFSALMLLLLFPNFRFRNSNLHFVPFESCGADAFEI